MAKRKPAPNAQATADTIRAEHARRIAAARRHTPLGAISDMDRASAIKRTAQALRLSIDSVKEAING